MEKDWEGQGLFGQFPADFFNDVDGVHLFVIVIVVVIVNDCE